MPKAVVCRALDDAEALKLESVELHPLAAGQVRVAIHAAGVNFPDLLMVKGLYQFKPPLPFVPGLEAAGVVTEVAAGADGRFAPGDRVMLKLGQGGYSQDVLVEPGQIVPLPATLSVEEGAAFLVAYTTAYHALVDRARIRAGEVLLVHGAGGGVGLAAVEIGRLLGASVIAAASSKEKLAVAQDRGAAHGVLYGREPFRDAVKRLTDGRGADVVFDPVGGEVFEDSLRCIAWGARLLVIGFAGGIGAARTNLVLIKGASVLGVRAGEAARRDPALGERGLAALLRLAGEGRLRPHISHRLPLARYAEAMQLLAERRAIGRVVLLTR